MKDTLNTLAPVIEAKNLVKGFGGRTLIDDLSFSLPPNGIVGVIGPNGVGKTTLFKTIVGLEPLDAEERSVFLAAYTARIAEAYPPVADATVLLRFPRLFIVAER